MASRRGGGGFLYILLSFLSSFFVFLACIFRSSMDVSDASVLVLVLSCHRSSSQFFSICTVRLGPEIPAASRYSSPPPHRCRNGVFSGLLVLLCLPEVQHLFRAGGKLRIQPVCPKSTARLDGLESPFDILPVYQVQAASRRG